MMTQLDDLPIVMAEAQYIELRESEMYDNATIYQMMVAHYKQNDHPHKEEHLRFIAIELGLIEKSSTSDEQTASKEDSSTLYKQALLEKDATKLYACGDWLAQIKRLSPLNFAITCEEIRKVFGKIVNWKHLNAIIAFSLRQQTISEEGTKPDVADIAHRWVMEYRDTWGYDATAQCWRMWNGEYWEEQERKASLLDQYAVAALQENRIPVNSSNVLNTFQRIAQTHCARQFIQAQHKVNFANGTLDLAKMRLHTYRKEDNFTSCLPYGYSETPHPTITAFLMSVIQEHKGDVHVPNLHGIQAYMAHIGLALIGDTSLHKALIALGVPGSGKSTLLDLANETCGIAKKKYVPHDIFSRELEGKRARYTHNKRLIACMDEVPADALQEEELFKAITAHSGVPMRGMNKDEQIENQWTPKVFMVANDDPYYKDVSGAIKRRLIVIRTPIQRYDEPNSTQLGQNARILEYLLPELDGFAATCIRYALIVRACGYYPQSASMKRDLDDLATSGNPLKACLEDEFILDQGKFEFTATLHKVYVTYCEGLGKNIQPLSKERFAIALRGMNIGITTVRKQGIRALVGIRLRIDSDPLPTNESNSANYKDSPLIVDSTMAVDGYDSNLTANQNSRQASNGSTQATLEEQLTVMTANSENLDLLNSLSISGDTKKSNIYHEKNPVLPPHPSTHPIVSLDKPFHGLDTSFKPGVTTVKSAFTGKCDICRGKAIYIGVGCKEYCKRHEAIGQADLDAARTQVQQ